MSLSFVDMFLVLFRTHLNLHLYSLLFHICEEHTERDPQCLTDPLDGINFELSAALLRSLDGGKGNTAVLRQLVEDVANIEEFYKDFGDKLPPALREELETLKKNLP